MRTKETVALLVVLAVAVAALVLFWPTGVAPRAPEPTIGSSPAEAAPASAAADTAAPRDVEIEAAERAAVAAPTAPGRGDLVVRLLYGDDRSPAAGILVTAFRKNEIPRASSAPSVDAKRRRTDAEGIARFPDMRAGRTGLIADRGHWYEKAYVLAGKETEVEWVMPVGVTVTGIVVGAEGFPVAGAEVELESSVVAVTDPQGRFTVRGASEHYSIGARAEGHGASKAQRLLAQNGKAEVRIELGAVGGIVEGVVLDPDGRPMTDVRVVVGRYESGASFFGDAPPRPARPRTDAEGRFRAIGLLPGEQVVTARAQGLRPWSGRCQVTAGAPASVTIAFERGNTLRGTLRDQGGEPFGDVLVGARAGDLDWDEVVHPDGTFVFAGLPDGEIEVRVDAEGEGRAKALVTMLPGGVVTTCELVLDRGRVVTGTVRDETGQPLPHVNIRFQPSPLGMGWTFTDEDGAFAIANAPEGKLSISIDGDAIVNARFDDLDPGTGPLDLRAQRRAPKTVYIAGRVLDPEGRPASTRVWASGGGSSDLVEAVTDPSGSFEIGPVPPGQWHLVVESRMFPRKTFDRRELAANSRWDVGTIRLEAGGDVHVEFVGSSGEGVNCSILDAGTRWYRLDARSGKGTSELLPVGDYRLLVSGKTEAAQSIPFAIRAGETTRLEVRPRAGVRQRFDLALPDVGPDQRSAQETPRYGTVRVFRGADLVTSTWARREPGEPCTAETCLEPGAYAVKVEFGELRGSAAFTVGEREGQPVRVAVERR